MNIVFKFELLETIELICLLSALILKSERFLKEFWLLITSKRYLNISPAVVEFLS